MAHNSWPKNKLLTILKNVIFNYQLLLESAVQIGISLSIFLQEFDTVKKIEKLQILSEK